MVSVVTGASGFIGSHLVAALVRRGNPVRAILRPSASQPYGWDDRVEVVRADLADGLLRPVLEGADTVFHCAAQVRPTADLEEYVRNNVVATRNLLASAGAVPVRRFVHFSSAAVHGEHVDHRDADEASPFSIPPPNPYVATKIEAERVAGEEHRRGRLEVTVLRPGWVWGPGDRNVLRIARQLRRKVFPLPGSGTNLLHLAYVENVVQGAILAAESPRAAGETFLLHDDAGVTAKQFLGRLGGAIGAHVRFVHIPLGLLLPGAAAVERIARAARVRPMATRYQVSILARHQGFSIEKARRVLGFRPQVGFDEAITMTSRWVLGALRGQRS